jgi:hypothetical protein
MVSDVEVNEPLSRQPRFPDDIVPLTGADIDRDARTTCGSGRRVRPSARERND